LNLALRLARLPLAICLILAALPERAPAATVVPFTLEQMEALSSDVVLGTVEDTRAGWDRNHQFIETRVRVRVERRLKGQGGPVVNVVVPGGVVGEVGMLTPGAPKFKPGERVLLLAEPKGKAGDIRPVGFFQGKLEVLTDSSGQALVRPAGPAWGEQGEPLPPGTVPRGPVPALPLAEVLKRLEKKP
jgi:hypothetical protein